MIIECLPSFSFLRVPATRSLTSTVSWILLNSSSRPMRTDSYFPKTSSFSLKILSKHSSFVRTSALTRMSSFLNSQISSPRISFNVRFSLYCLFTNKLYSSRSPFFSCYSYFPFPVVCAPNRGPPVPTPGFFARAGRRNLSVRVGRLAA